ncbi:MAG TPA: recombination-associated protein RdgC [Candidatus Accumulibacter phosphatis]|nr:MAG: Recombination-associated protein RdgC [Candidatus Accumulibacter sp. SK-11]HAY29157.1 recombination-associated protein RdgC [Accumulibacter sp.]HRL77920.1 recombination-associated protein RdgC [Candidatus Accumulibacter phosphatis]HCV13823.1 recombination-associated protein RdgC [Accumulibacter sp.]HRQ94659.1 recombination-associated protein RdgC [Candidatus Accumulibacter phosphatis]
MWFKNLQLYRLPQGWAAEAESFEHQLARLPLPGCGASDPRSLGWVAPRDGGSLLHALNQQWLVALGVEEKLLPASIVKRLAGERAREIEETEGRRIGRRELRELQEQMTLELLPRAFIRRRTTHAWIDRGNGWLVVDAASPAKAEEVLEHLRRSLDSLPAKVLKPVQSPSAAMTGWVAAGEAPAGFTLDQDLELRSAEKASVRYANHPLEGEEIRRHIADGKVVTRLAMTWNDRISFVLNDLLQIRRVAFLDILKEQSESQTEDADERFDIDFTLMTGEVAQLLADLLTALGGEAPAAV